MDVEVNYNTYMMFQKAYHLIDVLLSLCPLPKYFFLDVTDCVQSAATNVPN